MEEVPNNDSALPHPTERLCRLFADTYESERAKLPAIETIPADTSPWIVPWGESVAIRKFEDSIRMPVDRLDSKELEDMICIAARASALLPEMLVKHSQGKGTPVLVMRKPPSMRGAIIDGHVWLIASTRCAIAFRPAP